MTEHMKTHQTDLHDVDASILRENFKDRVLKFSNSNTLEETAEKFNLNRRVLEGWSKMDENKYKEVKAAVVDAHDVKEEVDDELPDCHKGF